MELTNTYLSKDEFICNKGSEIVHAKISVVGSGLSTVYKIYVYIRNVGWSLMGQDTDIDTAKIVLKNLFARLSDVDQNRYLPYPWEQ